MFGTIELDLDSIILMGHSFGGATVLQAAFEDGNIKAVVSLDPFILPII